MNPGAVIHMEMCDLDRHSVSIIGHSVSGHSAMQWRAMILPGYTDIPMYSLTCEQSWCTLPSVQWIVKCSLSRSYWEMNDNFELMWRGNLTIQLLTVAIILVSCRLLNKKYAGLHFNFHTQRIRLKSYTVHTYLAVHVLNGTYFGVDIHRIGFCSTLPISTQCKFVETHSVQTTEAPFTQLPTR